MKYTQLSVGIMLVIATIQTTSIFAMKQEYPGYIDEPEYPSYISQNSFGSCLRATQNLESGTVVGTKNLTPTNNKFIANHPSPEYRHVMVMGFDNNQQPLWGRVQGKAAFVNHSCNPNCTIQKDKVITTRRIKIDEELTISYDAFSPFIKWNSDWNFECGCGEKNCRKIIDSYKK